MTILLTLAVFAALVAAILFLTRIFLAPRRGKAALLPVQPFPPGFLWGSGEDAYQHEGGNIHADWHDWELGEPRPFSDGSVSGDCVDFWNRFEEDFGRAKADGHNAHRIGIEWSRVEPEEGRYDEAAWERYRMMLVSMRAKGFTTFVNLWHFTFPRWAAERGGWLDDSVMDRWKAFSAEAARRLGDLVDYWSTMIDSQIYALRGYLVGDLPPLKQDPALCLEVFARLLDAHAAARSAINGVMASSGRGPARVGQIYFFAVFEGRGGPLDAFVARSMEMVFNRAIPDALRSGRLSLSIPGGPRVSRVNPEWADGLDWLGVNYYYREVLSFSLLVPGFVRRGPGPGPGRTDLGWEIYPEGLYRVCAGLAARYPGLPLVVAENGIADAADAKRPSFIVEHLAWLSRIVAEGAPVLGYFHWAMTDNLEWREGFGPKFGLYSVDRATMRRRQTRSARVFAFIARENRLPSPAELEAID